ncbi:response regulator [Gillisia limnaea]|uniref:Response regulator receiver protein n=1 Tax=Gillisia limnaea (strain DSM 15749 / LMG 21470 / R-8282) TaxID=865937 RepID=H2BW09_GILLR|nr:response regulator [Gillisia limnaea]EHQ02926.1 response regulator receiver protein [Gillisia limnaea DSM 15749]
MDKILLVEDDHNLGIMICELLESNGHEVKLLRMADKTVKNLLEDKFDLVVMDKLLSGMDGTSICAEIRKTDTISQTPILMMSALNGARKICIDAGATDFIYKPFDIKDLFAIVKETIGKGKVRND